MKEQNSGRQKMRLHFEDSREARNRERFQLKCFIFMTNFNIIISVIVSIIFSLSFQLSKWDVRVV